MSYQEEFERTEFLDRDTKISEEKARLSRLLDYDLKRIIDLSYFMGVNVDAIEPNKEKEELVVRIANQVLVINKDLLKSIQAEFAESVKNTCNLITSLSKKRKKTDTDLQNPNFVTKKFRDFMINITNIMGSSNPGEVVNADQHLVSFLNFPKVVDDWQALVGNNTMTRIFHLYFKLAHLTNHHDPRRFLMDENLFRLGQDVTLPNGETVESIYQKYPAGTISEFDDNGVTGSQSLESTGLTDKNNKFSPVKVEQNNGRYYLLLESVTQMGTKFHHNQDTAKSLLLRNTPQILNLKQAGEELDRLLKNQELLLDAQKDHVLISDAQKVYEVVTRPIKDERNKNRERVVEKTDDGSTSYTYKFKQGRESDYNRLDLELAVMIDELKEVPRTARSLFLQEALREAEEKEKRKGKT